MSTSEQELQEDMALKLGSDVDVVEEDVEEQQTGVEIGPGSEQVKEEIADEQVGIELGDLVEFHSNRADIETIKGRVYYIDDSRISILEDGKSRKLVVFDMEKDDDDDWVFLPEYELTGAEIKEKRLLPSFVAQRGMARDMKIETFTADGEAVNTYTITMVDEVKDTATITDEAGESIELNFEYKGIPRDRSVAPFDVLRVIEPPKKEEVVPNEAAKGEVLEDAVDFEFLEELEAPDITKEEIFGLFQGTQKAPWEILYSDDDQINDMLRDRIRDLDPAAQKNTKRLREITRLVWNMFSLRNEVVRYSGERPVGSKPVAFQTLVELLDKTEFPLAKKVLNVARSIYVDHSEGALKPITSSEYKDDPQSIPDENILLYYIPDVIDKGERYLDTQLKNGIIEVEAPGTTQKIPRWITIWQGFFNKYFVVISPVTLNDDVKDIKYDQDFFRREIPKDKELEETLSGLPELEAGSDTLIDSSSVGKIRFSYMRALAARYGRYGKGGSTHKVEEADRAEINGYLIFPLKFIRDLGYTRSGLLALDVAFGSAKLSTMLRILDEAGDISDIPEANRIISVNFDGSTLGNTEIADWLKGQAIYGPGIGNLMPFLRSFGLLKAEFTVGQKLVLDAKVNMYRVALIQMLKKMREDIVKERKERKPLVSNSFLDKQREFELFKTITSDQTGEPILKELLADFNARHLHYSTFDLARFAYMYVYYPDLLINCLAQNPEVAKERLRVERDLYMRGVLDKLEEEKKGEDRGEPPQINPCQHVKDLNKIRKIPENFQRMVTFNQFITKYKLMKKDHWLWCNNGDPPHHLICEHEYLLLQEFLRPKEKDILHKEIILNFSGGKFNGQYICKQCGQPIADFEYERGFETSDSGAAMDGRNVLVDEDSIEEEKLQRALTTEAEEEERVTTRNDEEEKIYLTISEIASLVGLFPDRKSFEKMIARVKNALALVPDRAKYSKSQEALKKAKKATTDYDVFLSRILISLCGAALLIDVQTKVPDYVVRYILPGCANPSFAGFPRDPDSTRPETGMEYIACAISSVTKKTSPWDLTGFQSIASTAQRIKEIMFYLKTFTEQLADLPDVQQAIIDKKQYLLETFGYESALGRPRDIIPYGFTPVPYNVKKELGAEAGEHVVAESASEPEKVRTYIKQAHLFAQKPGKHVMSGPLETSCCYGNLENPSEFWLTKGTMPELSPRQPPLGMKGSMLFVKMTPRKLERLFGKADASIMYRLFIRVCFRGPRIGQQHEPGYDNICPWCEFKFPDDPRMPPPTRRYAKDEKKQEKYDDEYETAVKEKANKEVQALKEAGISEITNTNFEELLIDVNRNEIISAVPKPSFPEPIENLRGMLSILPPPYEEYEETIRTTLVNVESLPEKPSRIDIVNAFAELSKKAVELENELRSRLGDVNFVHYQQLVKLPPQELGEALRTYFLVPFQRILRKSNQGSLAEFRIQSSFKQSKDLSKETMDDIKEAYKRHTAYLLEIVKDIPKSDRFIRAKMQEVVDRLSIVIPLFITILRPTIVKGGALASEYLQRSIVAGIFAEFIMPNHIPSNQPELVAPTTTIPVKMPAKILQACLVKYKQEGLAYSQEEIREMIQDRIEKEKAKIIKDKNEMTPEQRRLDDLLQRLGMGKWAVGGTKAIWRYDPNQYLSERDAMREAGITRFGPQEDAYERGGGYDVVQTQEDDA